MAQMSFDDSMDVAMQEFELLYGACEDRGGVVGERDKSSPPRGRSHRQGTSTSPESNAKALARGNSLEHESRAKPKREKRSRNQAKTTTTNQKRTSLELDLERLQQLYGETDEKEDDVLTPTPPPVLTGRTERQENHAAARAVSSRLVRDAKQRSLRRQVSIDDRSGKCYSPVGPKMTKMNGNSANPTDDGVGCCRSSAAKGASRSGRALVRKSSNVESGKCHSPVGSKLTTTTRNSPNGDSGCHSPTEKRSCRSGRALTRKSSNTDAGKYSPTPRENGGGTKSVSRSGRSLMRKSSNTESYREKSEDGLDRSSSRSRGGLSKSEHRGVQKTRSMRSHDTTESRKVTSLSPRKLRKPAQDSQDTLRKPEVLGKSVRNKSRDATSASPRKIRKQDLNRTLSERLAKPRKTRTTPLPHDASTVESSDWDPNPRRAGPPLGRRDRLRSSA